MEILDRTAFLAKNLKMLDEMRAGRIFVYPTDTIYGIGCNATDEGAVIRIRAIKQREGKPFSVIVPSTAWIEQTCILDSKAKRWMAKLPGPYTLIMKVKDREAISKKVNNGLDTLGVRIPDNWFSKVVAEAAVPFVTTSVNITGQQHMTSILDMNPIIKGAVDYIIEDGVLAGKPSKVVDLSNGRITRK